MTSIVAQASTNHRPSTPCGTSPSEVGRVMLHLLDTCNTFDEVRDMIEGVSQRAEWYVAEYQAALGRRI